MQSVMCASHQRDVKKKEKKKTSASVDQSTRARPRPWPGKTAPNHVVISFIRWSLLIVVDDAPLWGSISKCVLAISVWRAWLHSVSRLSLYTHATAYFTLYKHTHTIRRVTRKQSDASITTASSSSSYPYPTARYTVHYLFILTSSSFDRCSNSMQNWVLVQPLTMASVGSILNGAIWSIIVA